MTQRPGTSLHANQTLYTSAASELDIEQICRLYSEAETPPEAFIVRSKLVEGQLLAISLGFLEDGQQLPCPGLPLAGAAFDPAWGFSQAEVGLRRDGSAEFRLPPVHLENLASGDVYGYRFCVLEDNEVPEIIAQLAHIRGELARRRRADQKQETARVMITEV
jgi:hypothetical protein